MKKYTFNYYSYNKSDIEHHRDTYLRFYKNENCIRLVLYNNIKTIVYLFISPSFCYIRASRSSLTLL